MRRSTCNGYGDRKTIAVDNTHDLRPLAPLGLPDCGSPFLAPEKEPSMKASSISIFPRSSRSLANPSRIIPIAPSSTQCWYRLWHVWYGGYCPGRSFQRAPVRKIQRIPFSTSRLDLGGRPLPSSRRAFFGTRGSRISHCASVRSIFQRDHVSDELSIPFIFRSNFNNLDQQGFLR